LLFFDSLVSRFVKPGLFNQDVKILASRAQIAPGLRIELANHFAGFEPASGPTDDKQSKNGYLSFAGFTFGHWSCLLSLKIARRSAALPEQIGQIDAAP
jgi:hypothetical protein